MKQQRTKELKAAIRSGYLIHDAKTGEEFLTDKLQKQFWFVGRGKKSDWDGEELGKYEFPDLHSSKGRVKSEGFRIENKEVLNPLVFSDFKYNSDIDQFVVVYAYGTSSVVSLGSREKSRMADFKIKKTKENLNHTRNFSPIDYKSKSPKQFNVGGATATIEEKWITFNLNSYSGQKAYFNSGQLTKKQFLKDQGY